uniref:V-type proton ATPase subunit S1/VOA1 transmembrane domain-containing protein n=2 Tax=Triticum aestivum TaxID=4565 RepID=A0A3B6IMU4_WHEAT
MAASAAFAAVAVVMLVAAHLAAAAAAAPVTAPAFLWAPENYGFSSNEAKGVVHYQTMSPASLAKSVLDEGGWSNLVCSREGSYKNADIAVVFLGSKLQSSDISKDKQVDPSLADTLKLSFTGSEFSMAFPYVALADNDKLESTLLSGLAENCDNDFRGNHITYTDTCTVSGEDLKKHQSMDSIRDLVMSQKRNNPRGKTDLIVFCNGGFKDLDNAKSEGELLSELVSVLKMSGARYTVLYASEPYGLLENTSNLPLARYLAEKTNTTTKSGLGKCDGECLVKSSLLEGTFVGLVLLIILISGLCCMMGIDTPSRFEAPQDLVGEYKSH